MATVYKTFLNNDIKSTRTLLHEAIPLTGALVSGTYGTWPNGNNIKNYSHGMFQSVYDYPYLSSSANHIFDLAVGYSNNSILSSSTNTQNAKKINMYNQMAAVLMGYDSSGSVVSFDRDGDLSQASSADKLNEAVFINFSRLLQKDEIKKGSFSLQLGGAPDFALANGERLTITDSPALTSYKVNGAAGEYGILTCSAGGAFIQPGNSMAKAGLIFYQAGVVVLSSSVFQGTQGGWSIAGPLLADANMIQATSASLTGAMTGSSVQTTCDAIRHRIYNIEFNNTTELNSTIHFCRVNNSDFNYSSNPSYLNSGSIVVKNSQMDAPVTYPTSVGLYSADNELLAVAKLSEPLKKDPTNEMIIRVRLDY